MSGFLRIIIGLVVIFFFLYRFVEEENSITELRIELPELDKEIDRIEQENTRLRYQIGLLEGPRRLLELLQMPQYQHLRYPTNEEVVVVEEIDEDDPPR